MTASLPQRVEALEAKSLLIPMRFAAKGLLSAATTPGAAGLNSQAMPTRTGVSLYFTAAPETGEAYFSHRILGRSESCSRILYTKTKRLGKGTAVA